MAELDKAELLEAVFEHYELSFPSSRYKICCPVHDESRPSCLVDPYKGYWQCYACQQGGDGYSLIMIREDVGFADAVRIAEGLLDRSGRAVRADAGGYSGAGVSRSKRDRPQQRRYVPSWLRQ